MAIGEIDNSRGTAKQALQVTNNGKREIARVNLECGFFRGGTMVGNSDTILDNLLPGRPGKLRMRANLANSIIR